MFEELYEALLEQAKRKDPDSVLMRHHVSYVESVTRYVKVDHREYRTYGPEEMAADFIASMTDDYFIDLHAHLFPESGHRVNYLGYFD